MKKDKEYSELNIQIGAKIKELRKAKGLTQQALSELTGINQTNISSLEKGQLNPSIKYLESIAKALNIQLSDMFI